MARQKRDTRRFGLLTWRGLAYRAVAVFLGLSPLIICEATIRLSGWDAPSELEDPYIGFDALRPLFVLNKTGDGYETAENRLDYFQHDTFASQKGTKEFRIFVLGGSTVWGRPFAKDTSFTSWLELGLCAADPNRSWRVVNCGGISYASYRLVDILREVLNYEPDLIILYTGHNEFLEDRTYDHVKNTPALVRTAHSSMSKLRTYSLCRRTWMRWKGESQMIAPSQKSSLPIEVDALLDHRGGFEDYQRDDGWRQGVIDHFEFNLSRMIRMCRDARIPIWLANPVANIKDNPPFKVEHRTGISSEDRAEFEQLWDRARSLGARQFQETAELLEKAITIDDSHAGAHYFLATCYLSLGRTEDARIEFLRAKDEDICPLRILEPMREGIRSLGRKTGTQVIDFRPIFEARARDGIVGDDLMADHVHPKISMHQVIAEEFLNEMVRQKIVSPVRGWQGERQAKFEQRMASLPNTYFPRAQQRLDTLRRWSRGEIGEGGNRRTRSGTRRLAE